MRNYYAVEYAGTNATTNRRHCAAYMRFTTSAQRDNWVSSKPIRSAIKFNDSDMSHELRKGTAFWDEQEYEAWQIS